MSTAVWIVMCSEPVMRTPLSGFGRRFFRQGHQAGHLMLGDIDFLAAPFGERDVFDFEILAEADLARTDDIGMEECD
jgi:hypothetical protein